MNINKAIKKQKKSTKRFVRFMGFIFILLPAILFLNNVFTFFILIYLIIIEMLIITVLLLKLDKETLKFNFAERLRIQNGIFGDRYSIDCQRVQLVHTIREKENLEIILILNYKSRNKRIKKIDSRFLKNNPWIKKYYNVLKDKKIGKDYYYVVVSKGGYIKYILLNELYKYCTKAYFTDSSIKSIKEYRNWRINLHSAK